MQATEKIRLPPPKTKGSMSLEEAIARRRSERSFQAKELTLEQLSQLLWATYGVTAKAYGHSLKAPPSAGACYPLEVYVVRADGVFRYEPEEHTIQKTLDGDIRSKLTAAALGQTFISDAPVSIVIAAVYERTTRRYGERGIRYTHIDIGHAAQNLHLQAVALGLGSVPVGAFSDDAVAQVLNLPVNQRPIYIIPVGYVHVR